MYVCIYIYTHIDGYVYICTYIHICIGVKRIFRYPTRCCSLAGAPFASLRRRRQPRPHEYHAGASYTYTVSICARPIMILQDLQRTH